MKRIILVFLFVLFGCKKSPTEPTQQPIQNQQTVWLMNGQQAWGVTGLHIPNQRLTYSDSGFTIIVSDEAFDGPIVVGFGNRVGGIIIDNCDATYAILYYTVHLTHFYNDVMTMEGYQQNILPLGIMEFDIPSSCISHNSENNITYISSFSFSFDNTFPTHIDTITVTNLRIEVY